MDSWIDGLVTLGWDMMPKDDRSNEEDDIRREVERRRGGGEDK